MGLLAELQEGLTTAKAVLARLDPALLSGEDAAGLVDVGAEGERVYSALKALAARRAAECRVWTRHGERSAAHWLARRSGLTLGQAAASLETAERLEELPATDAAFRAGRLSALQAAEIASVAAGQPEVERRLLATAENDTVQGLRQACRKVAASNPRDDEAARQRAVHAGRYLKHWVDPDGAARLNLRTTVEDMAAVLGAVNAYEADIFTAARRAGRRDPYHAYQADALVAAARAATSGEGGKPAAARQVIVVVDHAALIRGHTQASETCEVRGVGPIPVAAAQAMMGDAFLAAVVKAGVDIRSVVHLGRTPTAHQRTALAVRDPECQVPACHVTRHLQIDHVDGWAETHITTLDRLVHLCAYHHHQKTYNGYTITGSPGHWQWHPPPQGDP